ncbi:MAG: DUF1697 domain-containing protein [Chloroflexi bacterium]|nr:DUF1697 domain-containing protein [Chloroflexota bacterium]
MNRYIALLRSINVGGHTVKMDRLRVCFEDLRFHNVETFISSGNVIFETDQTGATELEARIELCLAAALGSEVATFLRTPAELARIAALQPFPSSDTRLGEATLSVIFLKQAPVGDLSEKIHGLTTGTDELCVQGREIYWLCRTSVARSAVGAALQKLTPSSGHLSGTMRNITTVRRLSARYPAPV